jgi:hypothetical protein
MFCGIGLPRWCCLFGGASPKTSPDLPVFVAFQSTEKGSYELLSVKEQLISILKHCLTLHVFDPCFAELDCRDDGAPLVAHLQRPVQIFQFLMLSKAWKRAAKLFSATELLISILKH